MEPHPDPGPSAPGGSSTSRWQSAGAYFTRWRAGDPTGLDDLIRLLSPVLWQIARASGLDTHRAEDVVQATWVALVDRAESIRDPQAVPAWLTMATRREAWRVLRIERHTVPVGDEVLAGRLPDTASAENAVVSGDNHTRLWRAVADLDARCRRLLRIVAFCERPDYAGIAQDLRMPIGSIGPTRSRCLAKLRIALDAQGGAR